MDKIAYEEITSVLAMFGRPDLIAEFQEHVKIDEDYKPPLRSHLTNEQALSLKEIRESKRNFAKIF